MSAVAGPAAWAVADPSLLPLAAPALVLASFAFFFILVGRLARAAPALIVALPALAPTLATLDWASLVRILTQPHVLGRSHRALSTLGWKLLLLRAPPRSSKAKICTNTRARTTNARPRPLP